MKDFINKALNTAQLNGASYADIRIIETHKEDIYTKNGKLEQYSNSKTIGFGIRVIVNGAWGFASSSNMSLKEIEKISKKACAIAKASSLLKEKPINLAYEPVHNDTWQTPIILDPFKVPLNDKLNILFNVDKILRKKDEIKISEGFMKFIRETKYFSSTEGTNLKQTTYVSGGGFSATAIKDGQVQRRSFPQSFGGQYAQLGYEIIPSLQLEENAETIRDEAISLLDAKELTPEKRDLIICGSQLALQIHESCGHPSELDRVIGMEENFAGSSFLKLDKYKNFHYGSPIVNLVADSTLPTGLGTFGWDDDGVRARRFHIVKNGLYQHYLTNRELAHLIDDEVSYGCNRADSFSSIPIIRMINISLMPGDKDLEEIIESTENGVMVNGIKTWSIDQMRLNFQFTCEIGWIIKKGKVVDIVKNPTYQGITPEFWQSCDAIANEKYWVTWGVINCGKGQPMQIMRMSHGTAPARFKNIMTGIKR